MDDILEEIRQCSIYCNYLKQKKVILQYPELKSIVLRLREINERMQETSDPGEEEALSEEYERLSMDSRVHDFMQAELDYCRMFQKLQSAMAEELKI